MQSKWMPKLPSEQELELMLMKDAYKKLEKKDPGHELLRLANFNRESSDFTFTPEFIQRCVKDTESTKNLGNTRYTMALRSAHTTGNYMLLDTNPPCRF